MPKNNTYLVELSDEDIKIIDYALGALSVIDLIAEIIAECEEDMSIEAMQIRQTMKLINDKIKEQNK